MNKLTWDEWFIQLASIYAKKSKDPSTQVGAIIVRPDKKTIAGHGYNGFPRQIEDTEERLNDRVVKYALIIHAEMNALINAREPVDGYTLYTVPFMPCDRCFIHMVQAGIKRFVYPKATAEQETRWGEAFARVKALAVEAKVELVELP